MTSNDSGNDLRERLTRTGFATLLLIGLMALALAGAGCGGDDEADTGGESGATATQTEPTAETTTDEGEEAGDDKSKETFASTCGSCHTLADAGTNGTVGPDLDDVKPDAARVEAALKNGGTSGTTMPKNLLEGEEAVAMAEYVSAVAGK